MIVAFGAMGDFLHTTPSIREIRRNYPYANITLIVGSRAYSVAECCPYVNETMVLDDSFKEENFVKALSDFADFAKKYLWKKHFSLGFNLRNFIQIMTFSTLLLYISGAKERVGYLSRGGRNLEKNPGNILLTYPLSRPKFIHDCARLLYLLKSFGLNIYDTQTELWYNLSDSLKARNLLKDFVKTKIKVVVGICANNAVRKYPVQKYLPALKKIIDKGASIIIFGGSAEVEDAKFLQENLPAEYVLNLTEILPGRRVEAAILAEHADMYIGNFTGSADMAGAAQIPCIVLLGPRYEMHAVPWQTDFIVLQGKNSAEGITNEQIREIDQIEPEQIVDAFDEMIHFLKFSGIRKTTCPPIIRSVDATKKLTGLFDKV